MMGYEYSGKYKDYNTALDYFLKSYRIVKENDMYDRNNINSIKPVAEMYFKLGDFKNSSAYYKFPQTY